MWGKSVMKPAKMLSSLDLIRIDVIIDKMVMLVWGLRHVFICSN